MVRSNCLVLSTYLRRRGRFYAHSTALLPEATLPPRKHCIASHRFGRYGAPTPFAFLYALLVMLASLWNQSGALVHDARK
jgi:hypothetical protein